MFIFLAALNVVQALRHSPHIPDSVIASLRSGVVLPANRFVAGSTEVCDSLADGPFCGLLSTGGKFSVEGIIDTSLWRGMPDSTYQSNYAQLSDFAQHHWSGSVSPVPKSVRTSSLTKREDVLFVFQPIGIVVDTANFAPSPSRALYVLNSFFGYISFVQSSVSVVEFIVSAPATSGVLVRAFREGTLVWARVVPAGDSVDVASASSSVDPSLDPIAYIEVIGVGAAIHSFKLSLPSTRATSTYLFMDSDLAHPSKYAGIRQFDSSAHLIDMESAVRQNLRVKLPAELLTDAVAHPALSYSSFLTALENRDPATSVFMDHFFATIEAFLHNGVRKNRSFESIFVAVLVESSPEVISFALVSVASGGVDKTMSEHTINLQELKARFEGPPVHASVESVISSLGDFGRVSFSRGPHTVPSHATQSASKVVVALYAHLGEEKFTEMVLKHRLSRLANSEAVATDGLDEQALTDILVEGLGLPITQSTPNNYKRELLTRVISILTNGDEAGSAILADILVS